MAWLRDLAGGTRVIQLAPTQPLRFGRAEENDVVLADDLQVSRRHAELICRQGAWWARDCQSHNGLFVNGSRVSDVRLCDGDRLRIGRHEFVFCESDDPLATMDATLAGLEGTEAGPLLSPREVEVLAWVASGATDIQIARRLGIGVATVQSHLDRIRDKTGRRRRPDLTRLAGEMGLEVPRSG